ncbi:nuclear transport factor 2 family protein [Chryseobacterium sp. WG23]|uniref:nuclear transport factor 2 family protein n=1 Tax=Chryseobacterium sp. WG23 TaxID=2926910 RepID=UPI00211DCCE9|nr:nuclear transport factor 2 family protein [Chryseobacterium sp. WG23]MCQ9636377.1 nuclear transport factor 2 family protein [Chryseobacterium sp. WG23]
MTNKEILEKANSAISKGDYEDFLAFCTDDVIWTFVGDQILRGKEEVRQYMAKTYLKPPNFSVEIIVAESEFVTAVGKIRVKNKNGQSSDHSYCDIWRFENKKMAELTAFVVPG